MGINVVTMKSCFCRLLHRDDIQIGAPYIGIGVLVTLMMIGSLLSALADNVQSGPIQFSMRLGNENFNQTKVTGKFQVSGGKPEWESVLIKYSPSGGFVDFSQEDFARAIWTPYDGMLHLDLGPNDGTYQIMACLKSGGSNTRSAWIGTLVKLIRKAPVLVITSPTNEIVTQPYLQLKGYSPLPLAGVRYDISNALEVATNLSGSIYNSYLDFKTSQYTTDFFQCYDIHLSEGQNSIALHAKDPAGNAFATNLNITLDYSRAQTPAIQILWPANGEDICGNSFTMRGQTEDAASIVTATITSTNGQEANVQGVVERTGRFWLENMPLYDGTNQLVLHIKNSAGLESSTNIHVSRSLFVLKMDGTKGDLWLPTTTAFGYESDATYPVWVNGVKAVVSVNSDGSGKWLAQNVPVTEGGVASFDMHAYGPDEIQPDGFYGNGKPAPLGGKQFASVSKFSKPVSEYTTTLTASPMIGVPVQPFSINLEESNATIILFWNAISNRTYQLQYGTDLTRSNWSNLGQTIIATNNSISVTDTIDKNGHRFYRVFMLP